MASALMAAPFTRFATSTVAPLVENAWKVHDFTRIPRMEKEGLIMYKNDDTRQLYLIKPTGAVEALPKNMWMPPTLLTALPPWLLLLRVWAFFELDLHRPQFEAICPRCGDTTAAVWQNQSTIAPLRGGMRAVYVPDESGFGGSWGFMNGLGKS